MPKLDWLLDPSTLGRVKWCGVGHFFWCDRKTSKGKNAQQQMTEWHKPLLNQKDKLLLWAETFYQKSEEMFWSSWKASSLKMLKKKLLKFWHSWQFPIRRNFCWHSCTVVKLGPTETPQVAWCTDSLADISPCAVLT